jgi:peptide deformylase
VRGLCCENRSFEGLIARVIQHEYDHIEGILFTDKISLKKTSDSKETEEYH